MYQWRCRELVMDCKVSFITIICNSAWRMHKIRFYSAKHTARTGISFYMTNPIFNPTVSHGGRQRCSSLPWVRVHAFSSVYCP